MPKQNNKYRSSVVAGSTPGSKRSRSSTFDESTRKKYKPTDEEEEEVEEEGEEEEIEEEEDEEEIEEEEESEDEESEGEESEEEEYDSESEDDDLEDKMRVMEAIDRIMGENAYGTPYDTKTTLDDSSYTELLKIEEENKRIDAILEAERKKNNEENEALFKQKRMRSVKPKKSSVVIAGS
jgi:hypothetical protein